MRVQGSGILFIGRRHPWRAGLGVAGAAISAAALRGRCGGEGEEAN
jgi:hypothetical protein